MIDAGPGLTKSLYSLGVYMFSLVFLALPLSFSCPSIKVIKSPSYGTDLARVWTPTFLFYLWSTLLLKLHVFCAPLSTISLPLLLHIFYRWLCSFPFLVTVPDVYFGLEGGKKATHHKWLSAHLGWSVLLECRIWGTASWNDIGKIQKAKGDNALCLSLALALCRTCTIRTIPEQKSCLCSHSCVWLIIKYTPCTQVWAIPGLNFSFLPSV